MTKNCNMKNYELSEIITIVSFYSWHTGTGAMEQLSFSFDSEIRAKVLSLSDDRGVTTSSVSRIASDSSRCQISWTSFPADGISSTSKRVLIAS